MKVTLVDWCSLARHFNPLPSFKYYLYYFETIEQINLYRDASKRAQIRLMQIILTFTAIMYFFHILYVPIEPEYRLLQAAVFNYYGFVGFPKFQQIIFCSAIIDMLYLYKIFYFEFYLNPMRTVLYQALVNGDRQFILGDRKFRLRRWMMAALRAYQPGNFIVILYIAVACYQMGSVVVCDGSASIGFNLWTVAVVSCFVVGAFLFACGALFSISITCIACCITLGSALLFGARHRMVRALLKRQRRWLQRFIRENVRSLVYTRAVNHFFGPMVTIALAICIPMNCVLLATVFTSKRIDGYQKVALLTVATFEMIILQVLHYLAATFSHRLHKPYSKVMSYSLAIDQKAGRRHAWALAERVKIACNIQAFHVDRRYGLTYGPLGLISMMAFVEFLFFYSEMLFYAIKIA